MLVTHDRAQAPSAGDIFSLFAGDHIREGGHQAVENAVAESPACEFISSTDTGVDRGENESGIQTASHQPLVSRGDGSPGSACHVVGCHCPRDSGADRLPGVPSTKVSGETDVWSTRGESGRKQDPVHFVRGKGGILISPR